MLNVNEVAEMLGLTPGAVRCMARKRQIPHIKLGYKILRFDKNEINAFINQHKVKTV